MATIKVGQNNLAVHYRISFPTGETYIIFAEPLSPETAREVHYGLTEEYALIGMLAPLRRVSVFLAGRYFAPSYVEGEMQLPERPASFLSAILPKLSAIAPADDILDLAEEWYTENS